MWLLLELLKKHAYHSAITTSIRFVCGMSYLGMKIQAHRCEIETGSLEFSTKKDSHLWNIINLVTNSLVWLKNSIIDVEACRVFQI